MPQGVALQARQIASPGVPAAPARRMDRDLGVQRGCKIRRSPLTSMTATRRPEPLERSFLVLRLVGAHSISGLRQRLISAVQDPRKSVDTQDLIPLVWLPAK